MLIRYLLAVTAALFFSESAWAQSETASSKDASAAAFKLKLKNADWETVQKEVAKHKGRIVVLDLWSTSCLPCMQEFPKLVELQKQHPKRVVCLSLNLDYIGIKRKPPEYYRPRAEKFLTAVRADFQNFICTEESDAIFKKLQLPSIPAVLVYGTDGKLVKRFDSSLFEEGEDEPFTYQHDINPLVEKLAKAEVGEGNE